MVSPRRPLTSKKVLQDAETKRISSTKRSHKVFAQHKFFLDIKSKSSIVKKLIEDLRYFGGTVDDFFSKEITTVITDAPDWKLRSSTSTATTNTTPLSAPSPGTPLCSPPTWSPAATGASSLDESKRPLSRTRVDTLLERARSISKTVNSGDVLENAQKWGLQVWSLNKVLVWIEKSKSGITRAKRERNDVEEHLSSSSAVSKHTRSRSLDTERRPLKAPFIKFETTGFQFRPVVLEFGSFDNFPKLNVEGKFSSSPFISEIYSGGLADRKRRIRRLIGGGGIPDSNVILKNRLSTPKNSATIAKRKNSGFCEICEENFTSLTVHLHSQTHSDKINRANYWSKVDDCINKINSIS